MTIEIILADIKTHSYSKYKASVLLPKNSSTFVYLSIMEHMNLEAWACTTFAIFTGPSYGFLFGIYVPISHHTQADVN